MTAPTETADIAALRAKANAGNADAQYDLGLAYANERGVPQDYACTATDFLDSRVSVITQPA